MKKTIKLKNLGCANCAAKIESAVSKLEGVTGVRVNFMSQRMVLEAADETVLEEVKKIAKRIEPDIVLMI